MKFIDLTGKRFGKIVVTRLVGNKPCRYEYRCDCGVVSQTTGGNIKQTKSCGCAQASKLISHKKAYSVWASMIQRCTNPNRDAAKWYLDKGITVCDRWKTFLLFLEDMGDPPSGMMLDRIDGDKGYSKENCRWVTPVEQAKNRSSTNWVSYEGNEYTASDLSAVTGVPRTTIQKYIKTGELGALIPGAVLIKKGTKGYDKRKDDLNCRGCEHESDKKYLEGYGIL